MSVSIKRRDIFRSSAAVAGLALLGQEAHTKENELAAVRPGAPARLIANENPYGPSESAKAAMSEAMDDGWKYAMAEARQLQSAIAAKEGVSPEHVLITAGSGELLRMAGLVYGKSGGEVIAARPTFGMLTHYAGIAGGQVIEVDVDGDMQHDLNAMADKVADKTTLIYICNPNNPTGTLLDPDKLRDFVDTYESRSVIFVDEAYVDLLDEPARHALIDKVKDGKNVIIARTFSKIHGLAGLRIGFAIARPDIIKRLQPFQMSMLNLMGLKAAIASYQDDGFQAFSKAKIKECISITQRTLDELGLPYTPSVTNFVLFDTGGSVRNFATAMRNQNIMVGRSFAPFDSWCRVSMGTVEQMEGFAEALRRYYAG